MFMSHIIAAHRKMVLKQQEYSLTKKRSSHQMMDHRSLGSSSYPDEVIMIGEDDENETLELNKKKKPRSVPWWDEPGAFNELGGVVKGLPKLKDAAPVVASSSLRKCMAMKYEKALSYIQRGKFFDLCDDDDESHNGGNNKTIQDPLLGRYKNKENISDMVDCFTFVSLNDLIKDTKKGNERSLSSSHHDNFTDMCVDESSGSINKGNQHVSLDEFMALSEDKILGESSGSNGNGNRHVTLEDLGVDVEDLKRMPWEEPFGPTWGFN